MEQSQQYQLGPWIICPRTNTLTNQTVSHSIDNKSMQVLLLLIAHQTETVSKAHIFEHVWKDKFVADDILSVTVSKIRKALGDNARSPSFIKTLPGVGYVLIAEAIKIDHTATRPGSKRLLPGLHIGIGFALMMAILLTYFIYPDNSAGPAPLRINSIAVLPFDDLSSAKDNLHFTDGLSDAIINQLSQVKSLRVISRYSSFTYRGEYSATDIGQALQVETLLDGSVQTMGDEVRINVRIFSTENGQQLWSKTFDSDSKDIFQLQDDISNNVQAIIQPDYRVSTKPASTVNAQAYDWYLMGHYHWQQRNPQSLAKAVSYFKHSLGSEPDYVDAHIGLAITYAFLHTYGNWDEDKAVEAALPHIDRALQLNPQSARALAAKGLVLTEKALYKTRSGQADASLYRQAQAAFLRSLQLQKSATTHHWYSTLLKYMGKPSDVIHHLDKAIEFNPLSAAFKRSFSLELLSMNRLDSAQRMFQSALQLEPEYLSQLVESSRINRYTETSIAAMSAWHQANPQLFSECSSIEYCEHLVFTYLSIGAHDAANQVLSNMGAMHFHFRTSLNAIAASAKGNDLQALRYIEPFALWHSHSQRTRFDYAVAQYRAGKYKQAEHILLQMYPAWHDKKSTEHLAISADNYHALLLYAATLSKLQAQATAQSLFEQLRSFLKQHRVFDKTQAEFALAQIQAQLGNIQESIAHLTTALQMGWMETYSREWWSLAHDHLLRSLHDEPQFQLLLGQHQQKRDRLHALVSTEFNQVYALNGYP